METKELILTSFRGSQQWSACLRDAASTNVLQYYKNGGSIAPKSLNLLNNEYLVTADEDKPIVHVWPVNSQEPTKKFSTILPEKATVLATCPRGGYLAAGIGAKLYLWHLSSGKLFAVEKRNFQPITCLEFSSDSNYLVVAGQDGMVIVYDFAKLVSFHNLTDSGQVEPIYAKHDHSTAITDIHIGRFGAKSRLVTVSSDQTCRFYNLQSGKLLAVLVFDQALSSVIFDGPCWNLFVGLVGGQILKFNLQQPPRTMEHHVANDETNTFQGHSMRVTCLDLNLMGTKLVSGSEDGFVFIWEIRSRQILKKIEHKGIVTNVKFLLNHSNFFTQQLKPKTIIKNLDRDLNRSEVFVETVIQDYDIKLDEDKSSRQRDGDEALKAENAFLRSMNQQLFNASILISRKYNNF